MFQMFHITVQTENNLIARQTPTQRVLELRVRPPESVQANHRAPLNLALVLDRSGSMSGMKLEFAKQAARHVVDLLSEKDRLAVVSYDDEVTVTAPSLPVKPDARQQIKERISELRTGGSTNLFGGWSQGCQEVALHAEGGRRINRVLLLTDGLANVGITDMETLSMHARELSQRGVSTSTFGVGGDFNEHLLEGMANQGGGSFYYIGQPAEIPAIFAREFEELSIISARDVTVRLTVPEHTSVEVLGGWRHTLEGNQLQLALGDLPAGRDQEIYIKLLLPPSEADDPLDFKVHAAGTGANGQDLSDETSLQFIYTDAEAVANSQSRVEVLERYARVQMSDQATEALKLERSGQREKARQHILQSLSENLPNMPPEEARYYQELANRLRDGMDEDDRKTSQYNAYLRKRGRPENK